MVLLVVLVHIILIYYMRLTHRSKMDVFFMHMDIFYKGFKETVGK